MFLYKTRDSFGGKKKKKELITDLWNVIHAHPRTGCGCHSTRHAMTSAEVNMLGATDNTHTLALEYRHTLLELDYICHVIIFHTGRVKTKPNPPVWGESKE